MNSLDDVSKFGSKEKKEYFFFECNDVQSYFLFPFADFSFLRQLKESSSRKDLTSFFI